MCSLMSEYLDQKRQDEAGSVLSTSLVLGAAVGTAQLLILTVSFPFFKLYSISSLDLTSCAT